MAVRINQARDEIRAVGIPVISISHGWTGATWKVRLYEALDRWEDVLDLEPPRGRYQAQGTVGLGLQPPAVHPAEPPVLGVRPLRRWVADARPVGQPGRQRTVPGGGGGR